MRILAIANQKGGCGKTTTSINLAASLAYLRKKVLLIDFDPQGHSTCGLGFPPEKLPMTVYELLRPGGGIPRPADALQKVNPWFDVLPSTTTLSFLEEELLGHPDRERRLKFRICSLPEVRIAYDYLIIDCPPNLGVLTSNALEAADEVIIPIEPSFFSLHGLAKINETIHSLNYHRRNPLQIHALLTIFDSRTKFAKEVYDEVRSCFGDKLFRTIIHESVTLKEASAAGKSIVDYDRASQSFKDYLNLSLEYLEREWNLLFPVDQLGWRNVIRNRYGPKRAVGGILFQYQASKAHYVEVAGDFNSWIPEPMVLRDPAGLWQKVIPVPSGEFRYKYIVDGEWQVDPAHPGIKENLHGTLDSFLKVV